MNRTLWRLCLCCVVAVAAAGLAILILIRAIAGTESPAQEPPNRPPPANTIVSGEIPAFLTPYVSKGLIEAPTEKLLAAKTVLAAVSPSSKFVNPKVQPGKVHWHKDFDAACRAAGKSGKPVLLFQMMGKLDDQFC